MEENNVLDNVIDINNDPTVESCNLYHTDDHEEGNGIGTVIMFGAACAAIGAVTYKFVLHPAVGFVKKVWPFKKKVDIPDDNKDDTVELDEDTEN